MVFAEKIQPDHEIHAKPKLKILEGGKDKKYQGTKEDILLERISDLIDRELEENPELKAHPEFADEIYYDFEKKVTNYKKANDPQSEAEIAIKYDFASADGISERSLQILINKLIAEKIKNLPVSKGGKREGKLLKEMSPQQKTEHETFRKKQIEKAEQEMAELPQKEMERAKKALTNAQMGSIGAGNTPEAWDRLNALRNKKINALKNEIGRSGASTDSSDEPPPIPGTTKPEIPGSDLGKKWFDQGDKGNISEKDGDDSQSGLINAWVNMGLAPKGKELSMGDEREFGGGGGGGGPKPPKKEKGGIGKWFKRGLVALGIISGGTYLTTRDNKERLPPQLPTHTTTDTGSREQEMTTQDAKFANLKIAEDIIRNAEEEPKEPIAKADASPEPKPPKKPNDNLPKPEVRPVDNYSGVFPALDGKGLWSVLKTNFPDKNNPHGIAQGAINRFWTSENQKINILLGDQLHLMQDGTIAIERNGKILSGDRLPKITGAKEDKVKAVQTPKPKTEVKSADIDADATHSVETEAESVNTDVNAIHPMEIVNILSDTHETDQQKKILKEITTEKLAEVIKLIIIQNEQGDGVGSAKILIENAFSLLEKAKKEPVRVKNVWETWEGLKTNEEKLKKELLNKFGSKYSDLITAVILTSPAHELIDILQTSFQRGTYKKDGEMLYLPDEYKGTLTPDGNSEKMKFEIEPLQSKLLKTIGKVGGLSELSEKYLTELAKLTSKLKPAELAEKLANITFDELNRQAKLIKKEEGITAKGWPKTEDINDRDKSLRFAILRDAWDQATSAVSYSAAENTWFNESSSTIADREQNGIT